MNFLEYADSKSIKINLEDILERIYDRYRWPIKWHDSNFCGIEIIDSSGINSTKDIYDDDGFINSENVVNQYFNGSTLILSRVQFLFKDIYDISQNVKDEVGFIPWTNIYMGMGSNKVSFDSHYHDYNVMVKNIFGKSRWLFDDKEILLKDQDVLYFPAYTNHEVIEIIEPKASITFNLNLIE